METPIEVLRVEQNGISKELARFRACDAETRSLYCREWAQFVYKKHFIWNAKTQEDEGPQLLAHGGLQAGRFHINFINEDTDDDQDGVYKKERSTLMAKKFMSLVESWTATPATADEESLIAQIVQACQLWTTLPSGYAGLPDIFEPVEFSSYPDAIPLTEDPKDPSQLLDPLIIERQAMCLPSDCFHLLKNLTGDILLSHSTPTCNHSKPTAKTPSDLDLDKAIFNEHDAAAVKKALAELKIALEQTWHPLDSFLDQLQEFDKRRSALMGKDCQATIDAFFASQNFTSFVDDWPNHLPNFKNKKSTPEEVVKVDALFEQHLDRMKAMVKEFMADFAVSHLHKIHVLTTDLWKMIVPTIYEMGERMAAHADHRGNKDANATKIGKSLKALDIDSLKKMESTKEVDAAQTRIIDTLTAKTTEYMNDIDSLLKLYRETRSNLSSRIDKLGSRDFKKKIKKVEGGYYSIRQTFRYEVTENIFPEALFCKFSLVCLEPLMQEGEVLEAFTIEKEVKRFIESHKDLLQKKRGLLEDFEQGVQTGRRELAGVLGKLFLKEGMRIQGDNLALKRQQSLLKSMGVDSEDQQKKKTKSKKKSSAPSSGTSTPLLSEEPVKKAAVKEKKPDVEQKSTVPEQKTDNPEKKVEKPGAVEKKKPTIEEKKVEKPGAVEKKKPTIEEKKPASQKLFVAEKGPTVPEGKLSVPEKKLVAVPEKTTPAPTEDKKPTAVKKKKPAVVEEKAASLSTKQADPPAIVAYNTKPLPSSQSNDIQDWDTIRTSVMTVESNKKKQESEVQDWDTLRTQVMLLKETKPSSSANIGSSGGWSSIAAAGAAASAQPKPTSTSTITPPDLDQWPSVIAKSPKPSASSSSSAVAAATKQWATPVTITPTESTSLGWSKGASPASNDEIKKDVDLGGWVSSKMSSPPSSAAAWSTTAAASWNTSSDKKPWNSPSAEKKKQSRWSTIDKDANISLGGWEASSRIVDGSSANDSWRSSSKAAPAIVPSWDNAKLPWNDEPSTAAANESSSSAGAAAAAATPIKENVKKAVVQPIVTSSATNIGLMSASQSLDMSMTNAAPPPGIQAPQVMPPGLSQATPAAAANTNLSPMGMPTTPLASTTLAAPMQPTTNQWQEPLPSGIYEMSPDMLLMIIKNLHRENGSLIQSVYNMQQEMSMMTGRYAQIIALARERETQTLALFETRKQTEMEEVRRYVLTLEARVEQLEEQQAKNHAGTVGFGNQDLFAGYREEQQQQQNQNRNHSKKLWQKNTVIRCGNCGEVGHASQECKDHCRYCGSLEHLSETCPLN
ncbi:hypothetical protein BD408DRAFT_446955 [Parasitella parasitica]|nr:hypothetical protein BD408DRAFT_446955 [Parasitella parasitica]